jgi:hypothetical protein
MKKPLTVFALGALIVGCGGGGGDAPAAVPSVVSASGLWKGATNTNRTITGLVLSDSTYYVLYSAVGNPNLIAGVVQGTGSLNGSTFSSSNGRDFNIEGAGVLPVTVSATAATKQSLNGSVVYTGGTTTFSSSYSVDFEVTPTLAAVAGTFSGQVALSQGVQSASVTVSSGGQLTGTGSGCAFSGTVTPRTDGNAYNFSVTFGASPCFFAGQTLTGIAYYDATVKRLYAAAPNASRTDGVLYVGTKL